MIGIDEVGRGSWAGPLLVCAVRFNKPLGDLKTLNYYQPQNGSTEEKNYKKR